LGSDADQRIATCSSVIERGPESTSRNWQQWLTRTQRVLLAGAVVASLAAGAVTLVKANPILAFAVSAIALALLATVVGTATEQLGEHLGPGATGVLQALLGNMPELFVAIFALRAGLVHIVQAALVGSILGNSLLVLGIAFLVGGLRHGTQVFKAEAPRTIAVLTALAIAALAIPTAAAGLHTPAAGHEQELAIACAIVLLAVFVLSIPSSLSGGPQAVGGHADEAMRARTWPVPFAILVLALSAGLAAFVSDWFVAGLTPAMDTLGVSPLFSGLVIVALAGNAVENVVGIQLAGRNKPDYAVSVILNSSLQVAIGLTPVLVLISHLLSSNPLTLVLPGLLLAALVAAGVVEALIVYDGESTWLEGAALIALYVIIAAAFWWG
jgi:Ca2+:H+ antiporter